ncbi:MAG: DUF503 domain-containing protein [Chloroflexota bacterium]|nr:DUF503 domain-containing protein [Chloroflexota bacterium]
MVVGLCTISLYLPGNSSLKGKRRVVKSITSRLRREFNVSIAEVDEQDRWQRIELGVACVSSSGDYARGLLAKVVNWIESDRPDAPIIDFRIELL